MALGSLPSCNLTLLSCQSWCWSWQDHRKRTVVVNKDDPGYRGSSGSIWSVSFMQFPSWWMKATDGEELRNRISKDFEMVGKERSLKDRVRSSCWASTTHEHIVFREKLCKRVSGTQELVLIPSSKDSGTLPSPTMTIFFLFVFSLTHHSEKAQQQGPRHVQPHRPWPECDFWLIFAEFSWISYPGRLAGHAVTFLAITSGYNLGVRILFHQCVGFYKPAFLRGLVVNEAYSQLALWRTYNLNKPAWNRPFAQYNNNMALIQVSGLHNR